MSISTQEAAVERLDYARGNHCTPLDAVMDTDKLQQIQAHARALAGLLYGETEPEQLTTLEGIESAVRGHILEHVSPAIGHFLLQQQAAQAVGEVDTSKASLAKSASPKTRQKSFKSKHAPN